MNCHICTKAVTAARRANTLGFFKKHVDLEGVWEECVIFLCSDCDFLPYHFKLLTQLYQFDPLREGIPNSTVIYDIGDNWPYPDKKVLEGLDRLKAMGLVTVSSHYVDITDRGYITLVERGLDLL